jgi:hypothetical protein
MYQVRDIIKEKIMVNYIEKSYEYDVDSLIHGRRRWKKTGQAFETMSKIFLALGGILSFSSGYFDIKALSFLSGSISVISLSFLQFSSFCYLENKKQSNELNIVLKKLGLETLPELSRDNDIIQKRESPYYYEQLVNQSNKNKNNYNMNLAVESNNNIIEALDQKNNNNYNNNTQINKLNSIDYDLEIGTNFTEKMTGTEKKFNNEKSVSLKSINLDFVPEKES